jgi:cyclase
VNIRIIPRLDIKGPNLVKGIHFEGLRVLGKPENFARHYFEHGADELIYMDAVASLYGRNSLQAIIERTSREIFIPLCVGGGLRSVDDIKAVLRAGADKVALNTAAIARPELIRDASRAFGSSTIVVSIEAIRKSNGTYEAYTDFGRQASSRHAVDWAIQAVELGAGELVVTSIDRDGTAAGYDLELTRTIAQRVPVPVIASGGAGSVAHVCEVIRDGLADAVSLASLLHYNRLRHAADAGDDFASEGNIEFLKRGGTYSRLEDASLRDVKRALDQTGIECRFEAAS